MDKENKRSNNRHNNNRPNGQNWRKNNRNGDDNNKKGPVAGSSGAGNPNDKKKRTFEAEHPIGYRTLETVLKTENDSELILKLSSNTNGFLLLLDKQSLRTDFMCLILAALARVSKSSTELDTTQLRVHFYMKIVPKLGSKSNFHRELKLFIADLSNLLGYTSSFRQKYVDAVQDLLIFLRQLQLTIYQKSFDAVQNLMQLITAQIEFINRKGNALNAFIVETIAQLNDSVEKFEEMREETEQIEVLMEPPEDFRKIGIYPDTFDILSNHEPFIRKNIVNGKYLAVDHYLDVQFRLLREDFVRPLRNGITEYRQIRNDPKARATKKFRINDLNVYQNVKMHGSRMLHNDQVHFCSFDCTPFKNLRWQVIGICEMFSFLFLEITLNIDRFYLCSTINA